MLSSLIFGLFYLSLTSDFQLGNDIARNLSAFQYVDSNSEIVYLSPRDSHGVNLWGVTYLPVITDPELDYCLNVSSIPARVSSNSAGPLGLTPVTIEDVPQYSTLIALAPFVDSRCGRAFADQATFDKARVLIFINDRNVNSSTMLSAPSGVGALSYSMISTSLTTGTNILYQMAKYRSNDTSSVPGTNMNNVIKRIGLEIATQSGNGLPKLWISVLGVLAGVLVLFILISLFLNLVQLRRRRDLRRRIATGQVNLEALGVRKLTVPLSILATLPIRTYKYGEMHFLPQNDVSSSTNREIGGNDNSSNNSGGDAIQQHSGNSRDNNRNSSVETIHEGQPSPLTDNNSHRESSLVKGSAASTKSITTENTNRKLDDSDDDDQDHDHEDKKKQSIVTTTSRISSTSTSGDNNIVSSLDPASSRANLALKSNFSAETVVPAPALPSSSTTTTNPDSITSAPAKTNTEQQTQNKHVISSLIIPTPSLPAPAVVRSPVPTDTTGHSHGIGAARNERTDHTYNQISCPICLDDFVDGETGIRELPCLHIYHMECIDPFLKTLSSLCPLCKVSVLPPGYLPDSIKLTNATVRRERILQRRMAATAAMSMGGTVTTTSTSTSNAPIGSTLTSTTTTTNNQDGNSQQRQGFWSRTFGRDRRRSSPVPSNGQPSQDDTISLHELELGQSQGPSVPSVAATTNTNANTNRNGRGRSNSRTQRGPRRLRANLNAVPQIDPEDAQQESSGRHFFRTLFPF